VDLIVVRDLDRVDWVSINPAKLRGTQQTTRDAEILVYSDLAVIVLNMTVGT
jgi:hypothetical protein